MTGNPLGRLLLRCLLLLLALAVLAAHYVEFVRPAVLNWGATPEEQTARLTGDEIVTDTGSQSTRAITINAPPRAVWPWLAQTGQDRGGFYSFDLIENIVGCEMPTEDILRPERQTWKLGDKLWMYPSHKAGGAGHAVLRSAVPGHSLAFATRMFGTTMDRPEDGSWTFVVEPIDAARTRLMLRGRGAPRDSIFGVAFDVAVFEPIHFVMERRMMIGLKELAETGVRSRVANHAHVVLWLVAILMVIVAAGRTLRRPQWTHHLLSFAATAAAFAFLTLRQPPPGVGAALLVFLSATLVERKPRGTKRPSAASSGQR